MKSSTIPLGLLAAAIPDALGHDLQTRAHFTRQVLARTASPRASAPILAVGIALGQAMGAHPLHDLGIALASARVIWSAHLTNQVVLA